VTVDTQSITDVTFRVGSFSYRVEADGTVLRGELKPGATFCQWHEIEANEWKPCAPSRVPVGVLDALVFDARTVHPKYMARVERIYAPDVVAAVRVLDA
jgi:hypothetical protein